MIPISGQDRDIAATWWSALVANIPGQVTGIWFGLTELVVDGDGVSTLYVAGTSEFDSTDATAEWASAIVWWPEGRYARLPGLAAIAAEDWRQALDYATELVGDMVDPGALPPSVKGVGIGWDDGDARVLWTRL